MTPLISWTPKRRTVIVTKQTHTKSVGEQSAITSILFCFCFVCNRHNVSPVFLFLCLFIITVTPLALWLHQKCIHMVHGNKEAQKRLARLERHSRNGPWTRNWSFFVGIVVCACSRHVFGFKFWFFRGSELPPSAEPEIYNASCRTCQVPRLDMPCAATLCGVRANPTNRPMASPPQISWRLPRPPKGWQKKDRKSKRSKTPESRNISSDHRIRLKLCTWRLHTLSIPKNIRMLIYIIWQNFMFSWITMNFIKLTQMTQRHLIQPVVFNV